MFTLTDVELASLHAGVIQIDEAIRGEFSLVTAELLVDTAEGKRFKLTSSGSGWEITHVPEESSNGNAG